jgi:hypothetical protein
VDVYADDQVLLELLRNYQICHLIKVFVIELDTTSDCLSCVQHNLDIWDESLPNVENMSIRNSSLHVVMYV